MMAHMILESVQVKVPLILGLELKVLIYYFVTFAISGVHQPIFRLPFHRGDVVKNVCPRPVRLHGLTF